MGEGGGREREDSESVEPLIKTTPDVRTLIHKATLLSRLKVQINL